MKKYGILIPALNPDQKLIKLVHELLNNVINFDALVLVDDLRRGHGRQFAEDVLSARSAQRLYHGGGGRGARLFRHDADHGAVRHAVHALLQDHYGAVGSARSFFGFRRDAGAGHRCYAQSGRGYGNGAAQGGGYAVFELRRQ